ncbi:PH domain-containing protein [Actinocorallia sp. A-T 12471]|uniref:PH domain-containing protein n=1 Tax=Actinocorallia sp. A-T 12471 TaxID=3089813 RepID=UPI0029D15B2E|nr:PH domain-containing protein [Actinocorallia sp. A-T 12471]MDX6739768.1 PH domain-containing protein [Actinocorallia sp. A-T 12471]
MTTRLRPPAHRVSGRAVIKWAADLLIGGAVLTGVAFGFTAWARGADFAFQPGWLPWTVAALSVISVLVIPAWRYRVHRWEVSSDVVYTTVGWLSREWLLVPVSRIQTVDAAQNWLERLLDLATLKVTTASHEGSSELTGLPVGTATELAERLARRAHDLRDDAT